MKKSYSKLWNRYFIKLLFGVPFPPEPMPERSKRQKVKDMAILHRLANMAMDERVLFYRF